MENDAEIFLDPRAAMAAHRLPRGTVVFTHADDTFTAHVTEFPSVAIFVAAAADSDCPAVRNACVVERDPLMARYESQIDTTQLPPAVRAAIFREFDRLVLDHESHASGV